MTPATKERLEESTRVRIAIGRSSWPNSRVGWPRPRRDSPQDEDLVAAADRLFTDLGRREQPE